MKRAPNLEKRHFRTSKWQRIAGRPCLNVFFKLFRPNKILTILTNGDASECQTHKVFRLGPGS